MKCCKFRCGRFRCLKFKCNLKQLACIKCCDNVCPTGLCPALCPRNCCPSCPNLGKCLRVSCFCGCFDPITCVECLSCNGCGPIGCAPKGCGKMCTDLLCCGCLSFDGGCCPSLDFKRCCSFKCTQAICPSSNPCYDMCCAPGPGMCDDMCGCKAKCCRPGAGLCINWRGFCCWTLLLILVPTILYLAGIALKLID